MSEMMAMLTPKTVNLGGGGKGRGEITPQMVAAVIHNLAPDVQRYAFLKYSLEKSVRGVLFDNCYLDTVNIALKGGWKLKGDEDASTLSVLSDMVLEESINPSICRVCNGAGNINNKGACGVCNGTGRGTGVSIRKTAKRLKVSKHRADFFWMDKVRILMSRYIEWEHDIDSAIKKLTSDRVGG
jgi:hypothetical protein